MPKESNMRQKRLQNFNCVHCVGHLLSLGLEPPQVQIRSENPLEKIHFSSPRRCQLGMASGLGMGALSTSSSQHWLPLGPELAQVLCVPLQSLCIHFCISPVVLGTYGCLGVIHSSDCKNLSTSASAELPEPWGLDGG